MQLGRTFRFGMEALLVGGAAIRDLRPRQMEGLAFVQWRGAVRSRGQSPPDALVRIKPNGSRNSLLRAVRSLPK